MHLLDAHNEKTSIGWTLLANRDILTGTASMPTKETD